jgi:hypothetical protein
VEEWEISARESIRHTIASYTFFADQGRFDEVSALFADDGVLEVRGIGGALVQGRGAIRDFFGGVGSDVVTTAPPGRMQHHVTSVRVDIESPAAGAGFSYFTVMTGAGVDHWGRYRDLFVPHDGRWLFSHRRVDTDGVTPGGWADTRR